MRLMNSARLKGDHASNPDLYAAELRHDRIIALILSFSKSDCLPPSCTFLGIHGKIMGTGAEAGESHHLLTLPTNATALWTAFVQKWGNQPGCGPVWTRSVVWARAVDFVGKGIAVPDA